MRKALLWLDFTVGRVSRKWYKTHNVDGIVTHVLSDIANAICELDIAVNGFDTTVQYHRQRYAR